MKVSNLQFFKDKINAFTPLKQAWGNHFEEDYEILKQLNEDELTAIMGCFIYAFYKGYNFGVTETMEEVKKTLK